MKSRYLALISSLALVALLASCGGGGGGGGGSTANTPLAIATQPTPQSVTVGQTATFSVTASGAGTLTYQWFNNGSSISGATASSYTTPATAINDNASKFKVVITDGSGATLTSDEVTLTVVRPNLSYLGISEVSSCYYYNVACWFEVYNPTSSTINLSGYQLKSTSVDATNGSSSSSTTFSLPSFDVPAGAYVLVSGNVNSLAQSGTQLIQVRSGNQVPWWSANGFIELISGGTTVDFVRFGTSVQAPTSGAAWTGSSVAALPYSATSYGKSIVRLYPDNATIDTNTASDWSAVDWATPGGRNDIPAGTLDADGDGIPDSAESSGGTYAGIDLYSMGARVNQKDIFIELDAMSSTDPGVIPRSESLQKVVDAFSAQSISVHFDAGNSFSSSFSVASFNLGQGSNIVPYESCVTLDQSTCSSNTSSRRSIYDWKSDNMDLRRRNIFHYLLMGNSQLANGAAGSSGLAELNGNDFIVTMGNWGFTTTPGSSLNQLVNMQASTIMHELGHNLGLQHGGNEAKNYKPNYWSIMNYMYQLNGLDASPAGASAYQRWRKEKGDGSPTLCSLANSPCGTPSQFLMSYSDGTSSSLNEAALSEAVNIGRGSSGGAYADWNLSGTLTAGSVSRDLNGDSALNTLSDYNDWANIAYPFLRSSQSQFGVARMLDFRLDIAPVDSKPNLDPISDDRQPVAEEIAPTTKFFEQIRNAR